MGRGYDSLFGHSDSPPRPATHWLARPPIAVRHAHFERWKGRDRYSRRAGYGYGLRDKRPASAPGGLESVRPFGAAQSVVISFAVFAAVAIRATLRREGR
jgi:hypothetical protein